jgi:ABC-type transport system substrate-binding protein
VVPGAAAAMPEVSADGKTYTIRLKKGILFTPDAAFGGKHARTDDGRLRVFVEAPVRPAPRFAAHVAVRRQGGGPGRPGEGAAKSNKFDYSKKVAGLEILDPYTLRVTLTKTDFNFPMILAYVPTAAVAREVVEKYGDVKGEVGSNPVGTGYYTWANGRAATASC